MDYSIEGDTKWPGFEPLDGTYVERWNLEYA